MKVIALIENDVLEGRDDLKPEHGVSLHVEVNGTSILFDMGASAAFAQNAENLGVDVSQVEVAVISHHHFDHGGGLARFFELNQKAKVFLREGPQVNRYFRLLRVINRPIGLDLGLLERSRDRIEYIAEAREVSPGVHLLTAIGSGHPRPRGNRRLFADSGGSLVPDPFDHELLMVVLEDDGMAVFTGCSHHGVLNLIDAAKEQFPGVPLKAVVGGFHLIGLPFFNSMAASRGEVREIGREVMARVEGTVFSGHCTGEKAYSVLAEVMGDRLKPVHTGTVVEV
jgi:7,8-dihydropterin-6-yl-methyl-4-(beta-D-ribofuranosyl)aminobenzene 5'-phosphate synthase